MFSKQLDEVKENTRNAKFIFTKKGESIVFFDMYTFSLSG